MDSLPNFSDQIYSQRCLVEGQGTFIQVTAKTVICKTAFDNCLPADIPSRIPRFPTTTPEFNRCFFSTSTGQVRLQNTFLGELECDTLYHLGLDNKNHDLVRMFGDVHFVIMGGSSRRMEKVNFCFCQFKILSIHYLVVTSYINLEIFRSSHTTSGTC